MRHFAFSCSLAALVAVAPAQAQQTQDVHFKAGTSGATIKGRIKGDEWVNYALGASAGQAMTVDMATDNGAAYFNIFEPGKGPGDQAMFIGNIEGLNYSGVLPSSGTYTVQVYMMRSAARRNEAANYTLTFNIAAGALPNEEASPEASGMIPCKYGPGAPTGQCDFVVQRRGGGSATVHVMLPDGGERYIYFEGGNVDSTDSGAAMNVRRESDLTILELETGERYEIPDAVVFGG